MSKVKPGRDPLRRDCLTTHLLPSCPNLTLSLTQFLPGRSDSFGVFPWGNNVGQQLLLFLPDWIKAEEPADEGITAK